MSRRKNDAIWEIVLPSYFDILFSEYIAFQFFT